MPKRITPDEVKEMFRLYEKYGNCAEDARHMNRSASAVSRYIRMGKDSPQVLKMVARQTIKEAIRYFFCSAVVNN